MRPRTLAGRLAAATALTAAAVLPLAAPASAQSVCDSPAPPAWCTDPGEPANDPYGELASATRVPGGIKVAGWAHDEDGGPVKVRITVGGTTVATLTADGSGGEAFSGVVVVPTATGAVCATAVNVGSGSNTSIGCSPLAVGHDPIGSMDSWSVQGQSIVVNGWALDPDSTGPAQVYIEYAGGTYGPFRADRSRPDVGAAYPGYGDLHGYQAVFTPPVMYGCNNYLFVKAVNTAAGADATVGGWFCS
ncbi:hypothetical protein KNE206_70330 [Kitasatospora sp. NE20-6]|uniref:hypothetical protein n=1 Tax=Kitasatospora sp. NE20-6 TaxID=2859066 RepID=UPI0034DBE6BF